MAELPPVPLHPSKLKAGWSWTVAYFVGRDPKFWAVLAPLLLICIVLFSRSPATNFIFDEQEALLANPYVNAMDDLTFGDAIHRDFWGLPPTRSVGSYRPIPNYIWRSLWSVADRLAPEGKSPPAFLFHFFNLILHAINATLITLIAFRWTGRRNLSWLCGVVFATCALLTEAVSGIVGIADVLGGMGALLALYALCLPGWGMPLGVFAAMVFGLFSKESALVCVPLVPFVALLVAPLTHPERPARVLRMLLALVATVGAFVLYVELRKVWFQSPLASELQVALAADAPWYSVAKHDFLVWFHQAPLPKDPLNNPLARAETPERIGGALRVYVSGLGQVVAPWTLSGDYSFPSEPAPDRLWFPASIAGAALMVGPLLASVGLWFAALWRERKAPALEGPVASASSSFRFRVGMLVLATAILCAAGDWLILRPDGHSLEIWGAPASLGLIPIALLGIGLMLDGRTRRAISPSRAGTHAWLLLAIGMTWTVVSYFPHSNIPVVLPTVRAERFWYFPAIGTTLVLAVAFAGLYEWAKRRKRPQFALGVIGSFLLFQGVQAYRHAMDYRDDLAFWRATKDAVPDSAKAHLNYSVMKGARRDYETRLVHSKIAMRLAPKWPMAHIYTGDTLCRMHRAEEAWPHYKHGFEIGKDDIGLIALALQCLWEEGRLYDHEDELRKMVDELPGSWLAYLASDTLNNAEEHGGVDPQYRPRGYNQGPKSKKKDDGEGGGGGESGGEGEGGGGREGEGESGGEGGSMAP